MKFSKLLLILSALLLGASSLTAQTAVKTDQRDGKQKIGNAGPIVVLVDTKGRLKLGDKSVTLYRLSRELKTALDARQPPERIIYVKAGPKVPFSQILKLLKLGRTIKYDSFGLILDTEGMRDTTDAVVTKIVLDGPSSHRKLKANPLYLGLAFERKGGISLNGESHTPVSLTNKLRDLFKNRANMGVYVEGTEEVEQTVFLVPSATTTFESIVKAASLVKDAGAKPIGIEIDGPRQIAIDMINIQPE